MLWWAPVLLFQIPQPLDLPTVAKNPYTAQSDIAAGKRLYGGRCAGCHGPTGDGGKGANLGVPVLPRAADDLALYRVIRYGLPETEMPDKFAGRYVASRWVPTELGKLACAKAVNCGSANVNNPFALCDERSGSTAKYPNRW